MAIECLVFDVDDTLYLERDFVRSGFDAVGRWAHTALGIDGFADRCWRLFETGVRGSIFDQALAQMGRSTDASHIARMVEVYRGHDPDIALLPDVSKFLTQYKRTPMAAITDGPAIAQRRKVAALDLHCWMNPIVVTEELGPHAHKPSPLAFERVQGTLGESGDRCCYVGDNPVKDFAAPYAMGWRTVRIRRPGGLHGDARSGLDVEFEIDSLAALGRIVSRSGESTR